MDDQASQNSTAHPTSLLDGMAAEIASLLDIKSIKHRSALQKLGSVDGRAVVQTIYARITANYVRSGATKGKDRSGQNWRWPSQQFGIAPHNKSPEVRVERAIARAAKTLGSEAWANQIPVASGLIAGARDRRRAIDLIRKCAPGHFELIELKIASDTPLYAAIEILGYGCLWLLARADRPTRSTELLEASAIDLRVLAPAKFYEGFALSQLAEALDQGVRSLGETLQVRMSFGFHVLDSSIVHTSMPSDQALLAALENSQPLGQVARQ
jgi:hypothetical protein